MQDEQNTLADHTWQRRCTLIYRLRLSALYHLKRARFLDRVDQAASALTALAATSAVGSIIGQMNPGIVSSIAAATAVLALVPLVLAPARKAREHAVLAQEFRHLLADCEMAGEEWTPAQCDQFVGRSIDLEAAEPAPLTGVVADCQNQLAAMTGGPLVRLTRWHRLLMHWVDLDTRRLSGA